LDWAHPVSIRIEFSDNFAIRIRGASDGETVIVDDHALEGPVDMAESGKIGVHPLTSRLDNAVVSSKIAAANKIIDKNDLVVGLAFVSNDGPILCVWNYGDELHYGSFATMAEQDWGAEPRVSDTKFSLR
jgi:hypothetical protein